METFIINLLGQSYMWIVQFMKPLDICDLLKYKLLTNLIIPSIPLLSPSQHVAPPSPASSGVVSEQEYNSRSSGASSPPLPPPPTSDTEIPPAVPPHFMEKGMYSRCQFVSLVIFGVNLSLCFMPWPYIPYVSIGLFNGLTNIEHLHNSFASSTKNLPLMLYYGHMVVLV